jgi:hypothetical protein
MGVFDVFIINQENIGKGFEYLTKGNRYIVAYNEENEVIAYTVGNDVGKQLMDRYVESVGLNKSYVRFEEEFHKSKDKFTFQNEDCQICIVDKEFMLKSSVKKLLALDELILYKHNKVMKGLDKYNKK